MNLWLDIATIIIAIVIMFSMDVSLTIVSLVMIPFYVFSDQTFLWETSSIDKDAFTSIS